MALARIEIETPRWLRLVRGDKVIAEARHESSTDTWAVTAAEGYGPAWECYRCRSDVLERLMEIAEAPAPTKERV